MSKEAYDYQGIHTSKTVLFTPLLGVLGCDKYLPLRYMGGLTIELELINDPFECLLSDSTSGLVLSDAQMSKIWTISDFQCKCDVIQLDNELNNSYVSHLLSGQALAINYNTYVSQMQMVNGAENSINITRSLSRLKSIFISHFLKLVRQKDFCLKSSINFTIQCQWVINSMI
jgi:hypothetical protein